MPVNYSMDYAEEHTDLHIAVATCGEGEARAIAMAKSHNFRLAAKESARKLTHYWVDEDGYERIERVERVRLTFMPELTFCHV